MANRKFNNVNITVDFNETANRQQISPGDNVNTLFGKIKKWLGDLKPVAFSGSYNDLTDIPSSLPANGGNAATADGVEWSNITNKPFTDGSQVELKDALDTVKKEHGYIEDNNVSFAGLQSYNAIGIKLPSYTSNYTGTTGKIIYTSGGTYDSFTIPYNGTAIPAGTVPAGYYKLGTNYGSLGIIIGTISGTTVDFSKYYLGESYIVENLDIFDGCSTSAISANELNVGTVGSSTAPVYINNGVPTKCSYSLGTACAKSYTDSSSASAISTGTNLVTERDVYYGLPKINGSHTYNYNTNIYAPTSAGTSGYVLKSTGSGTPSWVSLSSIMPKSVQADWNQADPNADDYIKNRPVAPVVLDGTTEVIYSGNMYSIDDSEHGLSSGNNANFNMESSIKYDASYEYKITIESTGDGVADNFLTNAYGTYPLTFTEGVDGMEATLDIGNYITIFIVFLYSYDEIDIHPVFSMEVPNSSGGTHNILDGSQVHIEFSRIKTKLVISEEYLPDSVKQIPTVTSEDEGKVLKVVNGVPTWVSE